MKYPQFFTYELSTEYHPCCIHHWATAGLDYVSHFDFITVFNNTLNTLTQAQEN